MKVNVLTSSQLPPIRQRVAAGATVMDAAAAGWAAGLDPEQLSVDPRTTRIHVAAGISLDQHLRDGYAVELTHRIGHGMCLSLADFQDPAADPCAGLLDAWRVEIIRRHQPTGGGGRR